MQTELPQVDRDFWVLELDIFQYSFIYLLEEGSDGVLGVLPWQTYG